MALEDTEYYTPGAYQYRIRVQPDGGSDKHRGYFPVPSPPLVNPFVARHSSQSYKFYECALCTRNIQRN